jgi:hypothetical protein
MKIVVILLSVITLSACTNYLYQGSLRAPDSNGVERESVLYWTKTEPLFSETKGGPATLLMECAKSLRFDERPEGIEFRGSQAQDLDPKTGKRVVKDHICGRFLNLDRFAEYKAGEVQLDIVCAPFHSAFSSARLPYIQASDTPYVFKISEQKEWSFFGGEIEVPAPPICQDR